MKAHRRDLFRLGLAAGAGTMLSGCSQVVRELTPPSMNGVLTLPTGKVEPELRLLNRLGFGPTPGQVNHMKSIGREAYVEEQLNPQDDETLNLSHLHNKEGRNLALRLNGIDALWENPMELREFKDYDVLEGLQQAAILRAVYSRHQLRERMVDFWSNHFNIYGFKGWSGFFKPQDELNVIRKYALGKFPDLVRASMKSPAMLIYLDNEFSRKGTPNENYARELMELHTMGVHGGYTQKDVQEVARCLTGWRIEDRFMHRRGTFRFDPERHDDGSKIVLGVKIPAGGGETDGEKVLEILANHPSTAEFISGKLCRYFLGKEDKKWIARLAAIYQKTGGDIRAMLRPLLHSPDLFTAPPIMKRPFDFTFSALRATHADTNGGKPVQDGLLRMGQPLYQWPMPDGYPDRTSSWTCSLLARWNFALALSTGGIEGTSVDLQSLMSAIEGIKQPPYRLLPSLLLSVPPQSKEARKLEKQLVKLMDFGEENSFNEAAALCLASPAFQWR